MEIFINYAAGIIAGCSYITMAMPFDLIKTKLQLNKDISIQYFQNLRKSKQGFFKTFYRGASSMYLFFGSAVATEFTVFQYALKKFEKVDIFHEAKLYGSGFAAGLFSSLIYTPIEYGKIMTQTAKGEDKAGSMKRILQIVKSDKIAGVKQIYTGLQYTLMREALGLGIYYGGFHIFMRDVLHQKDRMNAKFTSQVTAAMFAGVLFNLWAYPFDTFKTNIQSGRYKSIREMLASKFWQDRSVKQGAVVLLLKGLVADSVNLIVYENVRNAVERAVHGVVPE